MTVPLGPLVLLDPKERKEALVNLEHQVTQEKREMHVLHALVFQKDKKVNLDRMEYLDVMAPLVLQEIQVHLVILDLKVFLVVMVILVQRY